MNHAGPGFARNFGSTIGAAVINYDDLVGNMTRNFFDYFPDRSLLVQRSDDD